MLSKPSTKLSAASVLAMAGTKKDLQEVLTSPDIELRQEALKYASYSPVLNELLEGQSLEGVGRQTEFYLSRQLRLRDAISATLRKVPPATKGLVLRILIAGSANLSPGLELWGNDVLASFDGQVEDGPDELPLFVAH